MKKFMDSDFLLQSETSKILFHSYAENMPIFDWHCHLSPKEIYENKNPEDIAELWLAGDHYKWRAMRSFGIEEKYITGDASGYKKFMAWAKILPYCIGNPLYHWTHLELQRYFDIYEPLSEKSAESIWKTACDKISGGGFSPRELIEKSNVTHVCTTDDAADSLEYHEKLQKSDFKCKVLPAFRPDKALNIEHPTFVPWLRSLEKTIGRPICSYEELEGALKERIAFFSSLGCRASDHAFTRVPYCRAAKDELQKIFAKAIKGEALSECECDKYRTELFRTLAKEYSRLGWGCEIHIGATRNNNKKMFELLGADSGFDSIDDRENAGALSLLLDSLNSEDCLPKTILFNLNPKDNYMLGAMMGNFQTSEAASKLQLGSAWWFNDNIDGMRAQLKALGNLGVLGKFVGMITDSRSFLSYPRHEYFRRILCGLVGDMVESGLYPDDTEFLGSVMQDISYNNAVKYFGI